MSRSGAMGLVGASTVSKTRCINPDAMATAVDKDVHHVGRCSANFTHECGSFGVEATPIFHATKDAGIEVCRVRR